jgi:hypothetical protein
MHVVLPVHGRALSDYDRLCSEELSRIYVCASPALVPGEGGIGRRRRPSRSTQARLPVGVGVGVGGTLSCAARAGALGLPRALAVLGEPRDH